MPEKLCPKCSGTMAIGTLASVQGIYRTRLKWIDGLARPGFWGGHTLKYKGRESPVQDFACKTCGYVEHYVLWKR